MGPSAPVIPADPVTSSLNLPEDRPEAAESDRLQLHFTEAAAAMMVCVVGDEGGGGGVVSGRRPTTNWLGVVLGEDDGGGGGRGVGVEGASHHKRLRNIRPTTPTD